MDLDLKAVAAFVRRADTADLLDRVTVYRAGMEPAALELMRAELFRRGLTADDLLDHYEANHRPGLTHADGTALRCSLCDRPAVTRRWGWHRLFGRIPVFPRVLRLCTDHDITRAPV